MAEEEGGGTRVLATGEWRGVGISIGFIGGEGQGMVRGVDGAGGEGEEGFGEMESGGW